MFLVTLLVIDDALMCRFVTTEREHCSARSVDADSARVASVSRRSEHLHGLCSRCYLGTNV